MAVGGRPLPSVGGGEVQTALPRRSEESGITMMCL